MEKDDEKSEEEIDDEKSEKKTDKKDKPDKAENDELEDADGVMLELSGDAVDLNGEKKTVTLEEETEDKKEKAEKKPDKKEDKDETDYKAEVEKLRRDKSDLKKALHEERQKKKNKDEEAVALTEAELLQIMEEHKDDPKVMLNAMKYLAQQQVKGVKKEAVDEVETAEKRRKFDSIIRERYPDFDDDESPMRKSAEKAKEVMLLKEHPYGDVLGTAITVFANLPNISKYWFEQGKKAATDDKVNAAREKQIKDGKLTPPGSKSDVIIKDTGNELTESQMETAKKFGFDKDPKKMKIYKSQILGRKG